MSGVLLGFGIIALIILVGYIARRLRVGGDSAPHVLNRVAFYLTNPALLFTVLSKADLRVVFSTHVAVAAVGAVGAAGIFIGVSRFWFRRPAAETTIGALGAAYVNANNIGLPVAVYVLGSASLVAPVLLLQLIMFAPLALTVLDLTSRKSLSLTSILSGPVRNPMIIASLAGFLVDVSGLQLPAAVYQPFTLLGGAAVPLVLMAFGMSLHGARPWRAGEGRRDVLVAVAIKAIGMPLITYLAARFMFGLSGRDLFAVVALSALPTAQNVYNFASTYGRGEAVARDIVLISAILAIPVLIVIAALLA